MMVESTDPQPVHRRTTGPLTWGQLNLLGWMQLRRIRIPQNVVIRDLGPPDGASSASNAVEALSSLINRHEVLRTLFALPSAKDPPYLTLHKSATQLVQHNNPERQVRVMGGVHSPIELLRMLYVDFEERETASIDPSHDLPGFLVYERPNRRWGCIVTASHLVTDGAALQTLAAEYHARLKGATSAIPPPAHPLDVQAIEAGPRGIALSNRSLSRMATVLHGLPADHLVIPEAANLTSSASFSSSSLHNDLERLALRWHLPKGGVLTGLISLVLASQYGWSTVAIRTLVRMPDLIRGSYYVAANAIPALIAVAVNRRATIEQHMRGAWAESVAAFRYCWHDPVGYYGLQTTIASGLGRTAVDGLVYLNYHALPDIFIPLLGGDEASVARGSASPPVYRTWIDAAATSKVTRISLRSIADAHIAPQQAQALVSLAQIVATSGDAARIGALLERLPLGGE